MRILVDMDGIVVDMNDRWYGRYNADYYDDLTVERVVDWDTSKFVKPECGKKIYRYLTEPGFYDDLPAIPGAIEAVRKLAEKHDVRICTHPPGPEAAAGKLRWVEKYLGWSHNMVIQTNDKHWLNAEWLIDDKPATLEACYRYTNIRTATILYPYNVQACSKFADVPALDYRRPEAAWQTILDGIMG